MSKWLAVANGVPDMPPTAPNDIKVSLVNFVSGGHGETEKPKPHYDVGERAAIMAVGGMPSTWAAVFSRFEADRPPQGLSARIWQDRLDAILMFTDSYARDLDGFGWDAGALFAIGEHWQRLDLRGLGWFIAEDLAAGGVVVEVNARAIIYQTHRGALRTITNEKIS
jgi:hypothetical protein